jgi:hypothetical protein
MACKIFTILISQNSTFSENSFGSTEGGGGLFLDIPFVGGEGGEEILGE